MFVKNKSYFGIIIASMIVFGMIVLWQVSNQTILSLIHECQIQYQCAKRVNLLQTLEVLV